MGMIFDAAEMHAMMDSMNNNLNTKMNELDDLKSEITNLVVDTTLQGKAYDSSRRYFKVVWIPILNGMKGMCKATIRGNKRYMTSFHQQVDSSSNVYINTDYIEEGIQRLNYLRQVLEYDINASSWLDMTLFENLYETNRLQKIIENLYYFDAEAKGYYDDAQHYYELVKSGLALVSQSTKNSVDFPIDTSKLLGWMMKFISTLNEGTKDKWVKDIYKKYRMYFDGGDDMFGTNQSSPLEKYKEGDKEIVRIIQEYYPELKTKDEIEAFLLKLESEGCSYAALVNTIFVHFDGREDEFKEIFKFDMYIEENGVKKYNFNYVLVDLYCSMDDKRGIADMFELRDDWYSGTIPGDRIYIAEEYLKDKGIEVEYITTVESKTSSNPLMPKPIIVKPIQTNFITPTVENYDVLSEYGQVMLVCGGGVQLHGIGNTTDIMVPSWHVMTVLGYEPDSEVFIVSSWGKKYYVTQESIMNPEGTMNKLSPIPNSLEVIIYE